MQQDRPSATAWSMAVRRAAHQLIDQPLILDDPFAVPLVGAPAVHTHVARESAEEAPRQAFGRAMRAFAVARSRFAEDQLAKAVTRGVRQYVLLGAGLDTFALRNPFAGERLRVFEVDHPATQGWKRALLGAACIVPPEALAFVPTDFETQSLSDTLAVAGFLKEAPAVFAWLGVVPYLTREAFQGTLRFLGTCAAGSRIIFDYGSPPDPANIHEVAALAALTRRVSAAGEPFRLIMEDAKLDGLLLEAGLRVRQRLNSAAINAAYFSGRADDLRARGSVARIICVEPN